jgi:hypothetical protein
MKPLQNTSTNNIVSKNNHTKQPNNKTVHFKKNYNGKTTKQYLKL